MRTATHSIVVLMLTVATGCGSTRASHDADSADTLDVVDITDSHMSLDAVDAFDASGAFDGADSAVSADVATRVDAPDACEPGCHYDCFGGSRCIDGVVYTYGSGPRACCHPDDFRSDLACVVSSRACPSGSCLSCDLCIPEVCDGIDNNCNAQIDEGLGMESCGVGECTRTVPRCQGGEPRTCTPFDPSDETCDGLDNDCDGQTDEGCAPSCGDGGCD